MEVLVSHVQRFPDLLPAEPRGEGLAGRDAALARALYEATVRRWRTLAYVLNTRLRRPMHTLEPRLQATLLLGAAQILLMDRIPDHAAINESVEWTKRHMRPGASKMANAVLRAVARLRVEGAEAVEARAALDRRDALPLAGGGCVVLAESLFPEDAVERAAILSGLPTWLTQRWHERMGAPEAREQCLHTLCIAPVMLNTMHAAAPLGEIEPWPDHREPGFKLVPPETDIGRLLAVRQDVWIQDPASADAVASLPDGLAPRRIIDVCAGQGTKTRQLLARFPDTEIIASDVDERRMASLRALAEKHERLQVCPAEELPFRFGGGGDLVVLDVPCTNTGVLARRVEARHRCAERQLERLAETQRQIIADSIRLLAPGARLLYVTCSLEPEEGEAQARWTSRWHGLPVVAQGARSPSGVPGDDPAGYADGACWFLLGGRAARQ